MIAGRNGSGKSSFLRAIAAALSGPDVTYLLTETDREWVTQGHPRGSVEVDVVGTGEHARAEPITVGLTWRPASGGRIRPQADLPIRGRRERSRVEPDMWSPQPTGWFCAGYGPFRRLAGTAGEVTRLMAGDHAVARFVTLFREEASLAETVQWLQQVNYRARSDQAGYADLAAKVLALLNDGLLPDGYQADRVDPDGLWLSDGHGTALRIDEMSDGYRSVTALVTDIVRQVHDCFGGVVGSMNWIRGKCSRSQGPIAFCQITCRWASISSISTIPAAVIRGTAPGCRQVGLPPPEPLPAWRSGRP